MYRRGLNGLCWLLCTTVAFAMTRALVCWVNGPCMLQSGAKANAV